VCCTARLSVYLCLYHPEHLTCRRALVVTHDLVGTVFAFAVRHSTTLCDGFLKDARSAVGSVEADLAGALSLRLEYQAAAASAHSAALEAVQAELDAAKHTYETEAADQKSEIETLQRVAEEVCFRTSPLGASRSCQGRELLTLLSRSCRPGLRTFVWQRRSKTRRPRWRASGLICVQS
jgi:hypothetical protein